jgi:hypothetical protein
MKLPDSWSTHCPDCKARIKLPVTVTEGEHITGKQAIGVGVKVDTRPMKEHMRDKHPDRYPMT